MSLLIGVGALMASACSGNVASSAGVAGSSSNNAAAGASNAAAGASNVLGSAGSALTLNIDPPSAGMAGGGGFTGTGIPPGFIQADFGGYRVGDLLMTDVSGAGAGGAAATLCGTTIMAVIRDFQVDHQNFEGRTGNDRGLVEPTLGADRKPVFAPTGPTRTVANPAQFDEWYRDTPGVNMPYKFELWFEPNAGITSFQSTAFFPIDELGFGNEGFPHNFHFTTEIHTSFKYNGGENFSFAGDDDVWVFINNQLAIDLGGVHVAQNASINVDSQASTLGLVVGGIYPFDMFQNERHGLESNFRADTNLAFVDCGTILPGPPK